MQRTHPLPYPPTYRGRTREGDGSSFLSFSPARLRANKQMHSLTNKPLLIHTLPSNKHTHSPATPQLLSPFEANAFVAALERFPVKAVGSTPWMLQRERIEKLNMQAHYSAQLRHDEFIVDAFRTSSKPAASTLIHELIAVEAWTTFLMLPHMAPRVPDNAYLKAYMCMYHESTLCNILEVLLFHADAAEVIAEEDSDALPELTDYCLRKITMLNSAFFTAKQDSDAAAAGKENRNNTGGGSNSTDRNNTADAAANAHAKDKNLNQSTAQRLATMYRDLQFGCCACAVTILRFLTQHMTRLPLALTVRLLDTHDVIPQLVTLVEHSPWTRRNAKDRSMQKYTTQEWVTVEPKDRFTVTHREGQVWLALYNLIMEPKCRERYHYNTHRKSAVLKLKRYLNDVLIDQLPMLKDLHRFVEELALIDAPPPTASALRVVQLVPQIRENLLSAAQRDGMSWKDVAAAQLQDAFSNNPQERSSEVQRIAQQYDIDELDTLMCGEPKCEKCGAKAAQRCSRCKNAWYCTRKCQVAAWKAHKNVCDTVSMAHAAASVKKGREAVRSVRVDRVVKEDEGASCADAEKSVTCLIEMMD